ncbi:zinc finger protein OZF-like [Chrysoperla carnea]|uniref:zinc finger protein OZF-like n=1 Tax=Chrysoperla carnea TaxID=189513 RepID=UPI001D05FCB4|nr:zinc finger protein OZF-like [Chrysoperla carnea]
MYNFEIICRTCSCEGDLQSLFMDIPFKISEILTEIINIEIVEDDNFPQQICTKCLEKLKICYAFKQQCWNVNQKFKEYLNSSIIKIEKDEFIEENQSDYLNSPENDEVDQFTLPDTTRNSLKCESCGEQFQSHVDFRKHLKIHRKVHSHACKTCNREFSQKRNLNRHIKQKHPSEYLTRLKQTVELKNHFECKICHKIYTRRGSLYKHMITHEENKFLCNFCGKSFPQNNNLKIHKLIHTEEKPYKCKYCEKSFRHKSRCTLHELIHTGVKPHECDICHREFREKAHLVKHRRIHTGDKPYKCNICEQSFRQQTHLKYHIFTHSGEMPTEQQSQADLGTAGFQGIETAGSLTREGSSQTLLLASHSHRKILRNVPNQWLRHRACGKTNCV